VLVNTSVVSCNVRVSYVCIHIDETILLKVLICKMICTNADKGTNAEKQIQI